MYMSHTNFILFFFFIYIDEFFDVINKNMSLFFCVNPFNIRYSIIYFTDSHKLFGLIIQLGIIDLL